MYNLFDRILMLKRSQVFSEVSTESLRIVAHELVEESYLPGERVFDIDEQGDHMYLVVSGSIGISLNTNPEVKEYVVELREGDCFGEMGMLDDLPRSATAHVLEDSLLLVLEKSRLLGLISSYPELALGILRSLSIRLRETNQRVLESKDASSHKL